VQPARKAKTSPALVALIVVGVGFGMVCVVGVLAAIAIPAFINYVRRSKTSEAGANLAALYRGAASYYDEERAGPDGLPRRACTVDPATTSVPPSANKVVLDWGSEPASFRDLGFEPPDPMYYRYEIAADPGRCDRSPDDDRVYTLRAHGDLDGDGTTSVFELSVGSNGENELYRSPGIDTRDELE
jgi:type IV pilus assembly protein PilA